MLCHDFEMIAGDLVARRLMEAGKRERALRHASGCPACALRLKAERTLESGLRALGEGADGREAPAHLKTALRAAFDQHIKATPGVSRAPLSPLSPLNGSASAPARNSARLWMAAAALILISISVAFLSGLPGAAPDDSNVEMSSGGTQEQGRQSQAKVIESANQRQRPENQRRKNDATAAGNTSTERRTRRRAATSAATFDDMAANAESVTDYIPLTYLADATAVESGTVLRVELPPSALISMGLPMNIERTDSLVKADLIVGDDGVARAVRFVGVESSKEIRR